MGHAVCTLGLFDLRNPCQLLDREATFLLHHPPMRTVSDTCWMLLQSPLFPTLHRQSKQRMGLLEALLGLCKSETPYITVPILPLSSSHNDLNATQATFF